MTYLRRHTIGILRAVAMARHVSGGVRGSVRFVYAAGVLPAVQEALLRAGHAVGLPSPYHDGIPASLELDDIVDVFDRIGLPREVECPDGAPWPLAPRHRAELLVDQDWRPRLREVR